jgi:hypothetical protein
MVNITLLPQLPASEIFILEDMVRLQDVQHKNGVVMARRRLTLNNSNYDVGIAVSDQQIDTSSFYTIPLFEVKNDRLMVAGIVEDLFAFEKMPLWIFARAGEKISLFKLLQNDMQEYRVDPHLYRVSSQQRITESLPINKKDIFEGIIRRIVDDYAALRNEPGRAESYR